MLFKSCSHSFNRAAVAHTDHSENCGVEASPKRGLSPIHRASKGDGFRGVHDGSHFICLPHSSTIQNVGEARAATQTNRLQKREWAGSRKKSARLSTIESVRVDCGRRVRAVSAAPRMCECNWMMRPTVTTALNNFIDTFSEGKLMCSLEPVTQLEPRRWKIKHCVQE